MARDGYMVMISMELTAEIRRLYYAEHWKVGTIAYELSLHHTTVRRAIGLLERSCSSQPRITKTQPYEEFLRETLEKYPRLRATRLYVTPVIDQIGHINPHYEDEIGRASL